MVCFDEFCKPFMKLQEVGLVNYCMLELSVWFFMMRVQRVPAARMRAKARIGGAKTPTQSFAPNIIQAGGVESQPPRSIILILCVAFLSLMLGKALEAQGSYRVVAIPLSC